VISQNRSVQARACRAKLHSGQTEVRAWTIRGELIAASLFPALFV
jgi:hypothetical protein